VKHPEHARDAARAFAWVRSNISRHGGDPERLFLMGHSAGGHLTALLATDPKHLKAAGVPAGTLKGAIPMSGVYFIPALPETTRGFLRFLPEAFGSDPETCRDASPVNHLKTLACPLLVLTETEDTLRVRPSMEILKAAIQRQGVTGVEFVDAKDRNHLSIVTKMMGPESDPVRDRILEWVRGRCKELDAGPARGK
jgi:acetyl esterase/lipase